MEKHIQLIKFIHFHRWIFGVSPFKLWFENGHIKIQTRFVDLLPAIVSITFGVTVFYHLLVTEALGIQSKLKIVGIFQDGLIFMMFVMFIGTSLLAYIGRFEFIKMFEFTAQFDQMVKGNKYYLLFFV